MWAVVPVKELREAKRRLAARLEAGERRALVRAMLGDVLEVLSAVGGLSGVLVVTRDPDAAGAARHHGAVVLDESGPGGLNGALEQAAAHLQVLGARGLMVVPGDVPSIAPSEVTTILRYHADVSPRVSIVSDRHNRGTNCLAGSPPDLCRFHFGLDSFQAHKDAALRAGIPARVFELPGLQLDVDTPADVAAAMERPVGNRTRRFLTRMSVRAGTRDRALEAGR